jgi:site-specific DNA-methyltransferase (cytosine-N4-specific)
MIQGDALHIPLKDESVQSVVTSPPYWSLRTYGDDWREIGKESLQLYVNGMLAVFKELHRILKEDGTVWLNIADTMAGSGGAGGDYLAGGMHSTKKKYRQVPQNGIAKGSMCLIPFRIVNGLLDQGWVCRRDVIWDKGNPKPEDVRHTRRPGMQHEYVFLLSKDMGYKYHPERHYGDGCERGDVWHIKPASKREGKSPAPMPKELARRCIELTTDESDVVFDPFAGEDTTRNVARELGRVGFGMDLYGGDWL